MNLTNEHGLPQVFLDSVTHDPYSKGDCDYSTTELIRPPRIRALTERHKDQIIEDASDRVFALLGRAVHKIMEDLALRHPEKYIAEQRLYAEIDFGGIEDRRVSGQLDLYEKEPEILWDWKTCSTWKFDVGDTKDWEAQQNINALLCRRAGYEVKEIKVLAILNDWKKSKANTDATYPQCPVHIVDLPMWPDRQTNDFIKERIALHEAQKELADDELVLCSREERWARPKVFAVMKQGRKSAVKLCSSFDQAEGVATSLGTNHSVVERPETFVRCLDWCACAKWCDFGRELILEKITP